MSPALRFPPAHSSISQICANAGGASRASRCKIAKAHEAPPWTGRLKDMRAAIGSS
ncbi:UNVERIFIED_ORG: hypothetical protein QOE_2216 [Clostridioides difficile F501]